METKPAPGGTEQQPSSRLLAELEGRRLVLVESPGLGVHLVLERATRDALGGQSWASHRRLFPVGRENATLDRYDLGDLVAMIIKLAGE